MQREEAVSINILDYHGQKAPPLATTDTFRLIALKTHYRTCTSSELLSCQVFCKPAAWRRPLFNSVRRMARGHFWHSWYFRGAGCAA